MKCQYCKLRKVDSVHHIFFNGGGKNSLRQISDFYYLTIQLCEICHCEAHGKPYNQKDYRSDYKQYYQQKFLELLGVQDFHKLNILMKMPRKNWLHNDHVFMQTIKNKIITFKEQYK